MENRISPSQLLAFSQHLQREERAPGTISGYVRHVRAFAQWAGEGSATRENLCAWKEALLKTKSPGTVNNALAAMHSFLAFQERQDCRVKYLRLQKKMFQEPGKELTREEYLRLVDTALRMKKERLALLLETICATGVRVSEVQYITLEAVKKGRADIALKGKIRTILIPNKLAKKLQKYAKKQKIACGEIFLTASGRGISRRQIWGEMKGLCKYAGVDERKVFPHNLRHLFARAYYKASRDIVKLADVLGHSSIETTRIYLISTGKEHSRQLEKLGLIC